MRLAVLLSLGEGRGIMPPISSPKHVPTGVPSPSVNRKEWSVLGFYPGATAHGRDTPKGICVQFRNDFMWQFSVSVWSFTVQRERKRGRKDWKLSCDMWHGGFKSRLFYGNIEIALADWTTTIPLQKPWCIQKNLTAATLRGLISLDNVSERRGMMFVFWSVVRAKIITSQRTGGKIKRPFVSSQWSSWLESTTVTLRPCWSCTVADKCENAFSAYPCTPNQWFWTI